MNAMAMTKNPLVHRLRIASGFITKLILLSLFTAGSILFSGSALAEKIGYVDARRLVDESPQGQAQFKSLEDEFSARNREIKGKFELYQSKEADLQKNGVLMAPEELEKKKSELAEMQRELKRDQRDYNEEYNAKRNAGLAALQKVISDAVIFIAERDKYDLIVQDAVFASKNINLTEVVLEELTKRAK